MKKIINNKVYDTETAKKIYGRDKGYPSDLNYISETLYRKRTGEYFLHCEGGANTRYSDKRDNNSWIAGETISPISYLFAKDWLESNSEKSIYISEFGINYSYEKKMKAFWLNPSTISYLENEARSAGLSQSEFVEKKILE